MPAPEETGQLMGNLKQALINTLNVLPSPEGCGCAQRKRDLIAKLEGRDNART